MSQLKKNSWTLEVMTWTTIPSFLHSFIHSFIAEVELPSWESTSYKITTLTKCYSQVVMWPSWCLTICTSGYISMCIIISSAAMHKIVPLHSFHTTSCEIFNFGRFSFSHRPTNNYLQWSVISHFNGSAGIGAFTP